MPIDYKNFYNSTFFRGEERFIGSGEHCWPYDKMEAETFLSLLYYYKNSKDFLNIYSAYEEDLKKWNLLDLSKSALTAVLFETISLNRSSNQPLLSSFDWETIVNFILNSSISDGILRFIEYSNLQPMSSREIILEGSFNSIDNIYSFDKQLFNKKGLKNLLFFLNIDIVSANYIVDKTFKTKDLTLVKKFLLNLISFKNTKSSFLLTKVINDFNVFFNDPSFEKQTFDEISTKILENQYAELENFDVMDVFQSAEGGKSKAADIFVSSFMNDVFKDLLKQNEGENESQKILKSFESYLLSYNKNILLLEAPEIEKLIFSFTLERQSEISSLIEKNKPFYNEILKKMSYARLLGAIVFQTLVVARSFGYITPLPATSRDGSFTRTVQMISNENTQVLRATSNVPSSSDPKPSLINMPKPFNKYYQEARGISSNYSKKGMASKAIKQTNLGKIAREAKKAKEVAAKKALIIEKEIKDKVKQGNRRGIFDLVINGKIVYSDDGQPIYLANYLNSSMPYGQRKGIMNDFKKTLNGVTISRSELGLIESNANIVEIESNANVEEGLINPIESNADVEDILIIPKEVNTSKRELIIPNLLSPLDIEQEHITIEPLRKAFQIPKDQGSSFAMISQHHREQTELMTWILTPDFGYTPDKLDAIAWYADYLKPLYIENLRAFYTAHPGEVDLLNMCGTDVEGVLLGASNAFNAEIEFLNNKLIENKFLLPCSHVRLIATQASTEFENFGDKTRGARHSITQSIEILEKGVAKVLPILDLCDCVYENVTPGTDARAETGSLRKRLTDAISRSIVFIREISANVEANVDPALLDEIENRMANRSVGKELTLEQGEKIARKLKLGNVKRGVIHIWPNETFRFKK